MSKKRSETRLRMGEQVPPIIAEVLFSQIVLNKCKVTSHSPSPATIKMSQTVQYVSSITINDNEELDTRMFSRCQYITQTQS